MSESKATNLFGYLNNILKAKDSRLMNEHIQDIEFEKSYPIYMVNRYLSMHPNNAISSTIITHQKALDVLSPSAHYRYLMRVVPQTNSSFITYIK